MAVKNVSKQLTVPQATSQVRRILDRLMPGAGTTADSKFSWDKDTDTNTVVTTITFPAGHAATADLALACKALKGTMSVTGAVCRFVITRAR